MKEEAVTLSDGTKYLVKRPTLAGWKAIFESIPQEDLNKVFDLWEQKSTGKAKSDPLAFSHVLLGSLPRFPDMAAAVMSACLGDGETGKRCVTAAQALEMFDDDDVMLMITTLSESGFFTDIVARAKKLISREEETPGESE